MLLVGEICTDNLHFKRIFALMLTFQRSDFGMVCTIDLLSGEKTWHRLSACFCCLQELSAQFWRTTSKSAVVFIPQCCCFVISSLLLQTSLSYQYLIPMQSVDLVLVPLAPVCVKGDTSCAKVVDLLSRVTPYSWSEGLIFPHPVWGRKGGTPGVSSALCMVLLLLYSVQVADVCSCFENGHCNVEFILCLCK